MRNELNQKKNQVSDSSDHYFLEFWSFLFKNCQFSINFHGKLKNRNLKNRKIVFSIVSAHCAPLMEVGTKLMGEGSLYIVYVCNIPS